MRVRTQVHLQRGWRLTVPVQGEEEKKHRKQENIIFCTLIRWLPGKNEKSLCINTSQGEGNNFYSLGVAGGIALTCARTHTHAQSEGEWPLYPSNGLHNCNDVLQLSAAYHHEPHFIAGATSKKIKCSLIPFDTPLHCALTQHTHTHTLHHHFFHRQADVVFLRPPKRSGPRLYFASIFLFFFHSLPRTPAHTNRRASALFASARHVAHPASFPQLQRRRGTYSTVLQADAALSQAP